MSRHIIAVVVAVHTQRTVVVLQTKFHKKKRFSRSHPCDTIRYDDDVVWYQSERERAHTHRSVRAAAAAAAAPATTTAAETKIQTDRINIRGACERTKEKRSESRKEKERPVFYTHKM